MKAILLTTIILLGGWSAISYTPAMAQESNIPSAEASPTGGLPFHVDFNQITGTAVLGCCLWYVATRLLPETQQRYANELTNAREAFQAQLTELQKSTHTDAMAVTQALGELAKAVSVLNERLAVKG